MIIQFANLMMLWSAANKDLFEDFESKGRHKTKSPDNLLLQVRREMKNPLYQFEKMLLDYSFRIILLAEELPKTKSGSNIAVKLLSSGTSAYLNHVKAQVAVSPQESISKTRDSLKQVQRTRKLLKMIQWTPMSDKPEKLDGVMQETEALIETLGKSVKSLEQASEKCLHNQERTRGRMKSPFRAYPPNRPLT